MNLAQNTKLLWFTQAGVKKRESAIYKFLTKGYDASYAKVNGQVVFNENHLVQTTELNQPRLRGGIAPNEVVAAYNGFGEGRYLPHSPLVFTPDDPWSVSLAFNFDGSNTTTYICGNGDAANLISVMSGGSLVIMIEMDNNVFLFNNISSAGLIGKNSILTVTYDCVNLSIYINGIFQESKPAYHSFVLSQLFDGYSLRSFKGKIFYYRPQSGAMTSDQIAEEAAMVRSWLPEMESVTIGNQVWATNNLDITCTPMGNIIPEVQADSAVNIITQGDFESGIFGFLNQSDEVSTWQLNAVNPISGSQDGMLAVTTAGTASNRPSINIGSTRVAGKWYKFSFDYKVNSGNVKLTYFYLGGGSLSINQTLSGSGTYSIVYKATGASPAIIYFDGTSLFNLQIDNVTDELLGWAEASIIYDAVYAETVGASEVKLYAAVKEAAAWCYYNNDPENGSVFGKLYNWYAVKLLQLDIDNYNAANPDNAWGWRLPNVNDFDDLAAFCGGYEIAAPVLKKEGFDYWNEPNSEATNETGLTILGAGYRTTTGPFSSLKNYTRICGTDRLLRFDFNSIVLNSYSLNMLLGNSIRLIKS